GKLRARSPGNNCPRGRGGGLPRRMCDAVSSGARRRLSAFLRRTVIRGVCHRILLMRSAPALIPTGLISLARLPLFSYTPTDEPWTNYVIGRVQKAPTGSTMVEWIGRAHILRGYVMVSPVRVDHLGRQPPTDAGVWPARYTYHGPCAGGRYVITNEKFYRDGE